MKTKNKDKLEMQFFANDIVFKNIFNTEETLKRLLEETIGIKVNRVFSANTETPVETIKEKRKILDLIIESDRGIINVELNHNPRQDTFLRNFLYFCKLLGRQLTPKDKDYTKTIPHIQLNLTWNLQRHFENDISKRKKIELYVMDSETGEKILPKYFRIVNINMDYYKKKWYTKVVGDENPFLMLLAATSVEEMEIASRGDKLMEKMSKKVEKLNINPETAKEIAESLYVENEAEIWANTEHSRGVEEGITIGQSQGETNKAIEIAKNLLKMNATINDISKATGLSIKEIEELK